MPKSNHKESRVIFANEAKVIDAKVFNKLLNLIPDLTKYILQLKPVNFNKNILFLSGQDDYLFSDDVRRFSLKNKFHNYYSIADAGHVVNIDNPSVFNQKVLEFLK